jgi:ABC-type Fe3+-hydroxamate transport system substrate-binding protein
MSIKLTDQIGEQISIENNNRIISLVPSITETLIALGADNQLKGITRFCIVSPSLKRSLTIVGGTKNVKMSKIRSVVPDLIIANKEENTKADVNTLQKEWPVYTSNVPTLEASYAFMNHMGLVLNATEKANEIIAKITLSFKNFPLMQSRSGRVLYLIWKEPFMTIGGDTFIHAIIESCGWQNVCSHMRRYPGIDLKTIKQLNPDWIFLSTEPYPFNQKDVQELGNTFSGSRIRLVDGRAFSWFGTYTLNSIPYFLKLSKSMAVI